MAQLSEDSVVPPLPFGGAGAAGYSTPPHAAAAKPHATRAVVLCGFDQNEARAHRDLFIPLTIAFTFQLDSCPSDAQDPNTPSDHQNTPETAARTPDREGATSTT